MFRVQERALYVLQYGLPGSVDLQTFIKIDKYIRCLLGVHK